VIPCNAIVDVIREPTLVGMGAFRVEVWGREPHDYVRVYTINAASDTLAAQEGLRRFSEEISLLLSKEG
jgi:hypothetical protein